MVISLTPPPPQLSTWFMNDPLRDVTVIVGEILNSGDRSFDWEWNPCYNKCLCLCVLCVCRMCINQLSWVEISNPVHTLHPGGRSLVCRPQPGISVAYTYRAANGPRRPGCQMMRERERELKTICLEHRYYTYISRYVPSPGMQEQHDKPE